MNTKGISVIVVSTFVALLIGAAGCNSGNDVTAPPAGGGGTSTLVQSASTPADGDGTLTATATIQVNAGSTGFDEVDLSQTLGSMGHEVVVTWDTSTHVINSVQCIWGNGTVTSGFTQCEPSSAACDASKIAVDFGGQKVTFTGLVLADAFGGTSAATLTGTMVW